MAGHSQFKNIMHRKGAVDAKRAKIFNKLGREITVACKQGLPDPNFNPRLRAAIIDARKNNMPRDRIEKAIKSGIPGSERIALTTKKSVTKVMVPAALHSSSKR